MLIADDAVRIVTVRSHVVHCPCHRTAPTVLYNSTKGGVGVVVKVVVGEADSPQVALRGQEEGSAPACRGGRNAPTLYRPKTYETRPSMSRIPLPSLRWAGPYVCGLAWEPANGSADPLLVNQRSWLYVRRAAGTRLFRP
jgi:hypothetical protein